jgi:hypothetical protein
MLHKPVERTQLLEGGVQTARASLSERNFFFKKTQFKKSLSERELYINSSDCKSQSEWTWNFIKTVQTARASLSEMKFNYINSGCKSQSEWARCYLEQLQSSSLVLRCQSDTLRERACCAVSLSDMVHTLSTWSTLSTFKKDYFMPCGAIQWQGWP